MIEDGSTAENRQSTMRVGGLGAAFSRLPFDLCFADMLA
jgi:hypothetical protein